MKKVKIFIMLMLLVLPALLTGCVEMATVYLLPDAEGTTRNWTPSSGLIHYRMVDDLIAFPDEDLTYVYTRRRLSEDDFNHQTSVLLTGANISNVRLISRCRKTVVTDTIAIDLGVKIGGMLFPSGVSMPISTSYTDYMWDWATCPASGLPWTKGDIDNLESCVTSVFGMVGLNPEARCTQQYFIVTYSFPGRIPRGVTVGLPHII
jgi:hypothetical protein